MTIGRWSLHHNFYEGSSYEGTSYAFVLVFCFYIPYSRKLTIQEINAIFHFFALILGSLISGGVNFGVLNFGVRYF